MSSWLEETKDGIVIRVRVIPRAGRDEIVGLIGGEALKIRIQAPPVEGKANARLIKYLSREWKISRADLTVLSGETGRSKRLGIINPPPGLIEKLRTLGNR
jgi:hypothetical protein